VDPKRVLAADEAAQMPRVIECRLGRSARNLGHG
jgi:hypothetical protein